MTPSVFVGTGLLGFLAGKDGSLDFLPEGGGEPHGYTEFLADIDAMVIGRRTYETLMAFPEWPYGAKRVVVLGNPPGPALVLIGADVPLFGALLHEVRLDHPGTQSYASGLAKKRVPSHPPAITSRRPATTRGT